MEMVVGEYFGQRQGVDHMSRDAGALPGCEVDTLMTVDRTAVLLWVESSRNWSVFHGTP